MGGRHSSDLHMRSVEGRQAERVRLEAAFRWRVLGETWAAKFAELRKEGVPFDLVVFTGDLGDWGDPTGDPRACEKQTCAAPDVPLDRLFDRLFVIPGNHDVDRLIQHAAWEALRRDVAKDPRAYSTWMAGEDRGTLRGDHRPGDRSGARRAGPAARGAGPVPRLVGAGPVLGRRRAAVRERARRAPPGWTAARADGGSMRAAT